MSDGTEAVSSLKCLSRSCRTAAGQAVASDAYFQPAGLTYTAGQALGVAGTNFDRTTQD